MGSKKSYRNVIIGVLLQIIAAFFPRYIVPVEKTIQTEDRNNVAVTIADSQSAVVLCTKRWQQLLPSGGVTLS